MLSSRARRLYWSPIEIVSKKLKRLKSIKVDFASGAPDPELIPLNEIRESTLRVLEDPGSLSYPGTGGLAELRRELVHLLSNLGVSVHGREVIVTSGAQNALHIIADLFLDEEDYLLVENPTFIEAFIAFNHYTNNYYTINVGLDGSRTTPSKNTLVQVKLLYTMPELHNPTGTVMDYDYRKRIIEWARDYDLIVVEDDPYRPLVPDPREPLVNMDKNQRVLYVTSLSKVVAPGLRIGLILAPREYSEKIEQAQQLDFSLNTLSMHIVLDLLKKKVISKIASRARREYVNRIKTLLDLLEDHMPGEVEWSRPRGGFYVFINTRVDMDKLLGKALSMGVAYVPGKYFYIENREVYKGTARLSISRVREQDIEYGVKVLAKLIRDYS